MKEFGFKYKELKESFNYYVGLSENAISLLNLVNNVNFKYYISHKTIGYKECVDELYDPTDIILDSFVRDISEYIKVYFINNSLEENDIINFINSVNFSNEESILFLARLIYPSYYFNLYDTIIKDEMDSKKIINYIKRSDKYESLLKKIYKALSNKYNLPLIDWLNS